MKPPLDPCPASLKTGKRHEKSIVLTAVRPRPSVQVGLGEFTETGELDAGGRLARACGVAGAVQAATNATSARPASFTTVKRT